MDITVQADLKPVQEALERVRRDQVPYATASALTATAQAAAKAVQKSLPDHFRNRGTGLAWFAKGIKVEMATKTNLQAKVIDIDWEMKTQEEGGERSPLSAQFERVPGRVLAGIELKPRLSDLLTQPGVFQAANAAGEEFVARRTGDTSYPIETLYFLRPKIQLKPRFEMAETVEKTVAEVFPEEFQKAAQKAMDTAR